jgi:hypothetical protein
MAKITNYEVSHEVAVIQISSVSDGQKFSQRPALKQSQSAFLSQNAR